MNVQNRYYASTFGVVYFMTLFGQELLRYSAVRKRFRDHKALFMRLSFRRLSRYILIAAGLLVIGFFFPKAAIVLYIFIPVFGFFFQTGKGTRRA